MRISHYCYFSLRSAEVSAEQITARLGLSADEVLVRGSKGTRPREIPVEHAWKVVCREPGLTLTEQIDRLLIRLLPLADDIAGYLTDARLAS